jgi:Iron-containing redox enzyme
MSDLPQPRGETSGRLVDRLRESVGPIELPAVAATDPLSDEDLQLSLYVCYELHYRGFDGVDPAWEWEPSLIAARSALERQFDAALREAVGDREGPSPPPDEMDLALRAVAEADDAPSVSRFIEREASLEQVHEFMIHRSAYQLKEADPHTWAIPRMHGGPKAAMIEVQADEYGGGRAERIHAQLFADALEAVGLDPTYGAYLDRIPGFTLATVNLMSMCGLRRELLGAIVGHLALFEMTSSVPNRRYGDGLRRLGFDGAATEFFDEHVIADSVHENIAAVDLAGGLARQQPQLAADVLWGARALVLLDGRWASRLHAAWEAGASSLVPEPPVRAVA